MTDICMNDDFDLLIENGDFKIENSLEKEVKILLLSTPGNFKNAPLLGCDIQLLVQSNQYAGIKAEVLRQLKADGKDMNVIINPDGTLNITKR